MSSAGPVGTGFYNGMTMMLRFWNSVCCMVARYFAVKVFAPALRPVTRYVAPAWLERPGAALITNDVASSAGTVDAPEISKAMAAPLGIFEVRVTSTRPETPTMAVTAGPAVDRSV
jgi:hypothetical protein